MTLSDLRRAQAHSARPHLTDLLQGANVLLEAHYPQRAKFIRPQTTGRTSAAVLIVEETKGDGDTLHENIPTSMRFITQVEGHRAGPQLTQSRTQAIITCLKLMTDVRETDQVIITDPASGDEQRYHIQAAGPRYETGFSSFRIERVPG